MKTGRGFTFVELMLVMTIITILAAIAVPNFLEAQTRAKVARAKAEMTAVKMAMDSYRQEAKAWPLNRLAGVSGPWDLTVLTTPVAYLTSLPQDVFSVADSRGVRPPNFKSVTYRYLNGLQLEQPAPPLAGQAPPAPRGLQIETADFGLKSGFICGLMWSYGPGAGNDTAAVRILEGSNIQVTVYDPSNGTSSTGNLFVRLP